MAMKFDPPVMLLLDEKIERFDVALYPNKEAIQKYTFGIIKLLSIYFDELKKLYHWDESRITAFGHHNKPFENFQKLLTDYNESHFLGQFHYVPPSQNIKIRYYYKLPGTTFAPAPDGIEVQHLFHSIFETLKMLHAEMDFDFKLET